MEDKEKKEIKMEPKKFLVFYNDNGEFHEVLLDYQQEQTVALLLLKMHNDNIQIDKNVAFTIRDQKEGSGNNE
jgi:beta-galactosidase beta subunit